MQAPVHGRSGPAHLTRRWALRESLPPTEVTLQVYVPMSPDQVWEMCRVPSGSMRMRGMACTLMADPSFSQTCLKEKPGSFWAADSFPSPHFCFQALGSTCGCNQAH